MRGWQWAVVGVVLVAVLGVGGYLLAVDQHWAGLGDRDYPEDVRANFLAACRSSGGSDDVCDCALEDLEAEMSLDDYKAIELDVAVNGAAPREVLRTLARCAG